MKKTLLCVGVLCGLVAAGATGIALASGAVNSEVPAIKVSPSTIVLAKVGTVTVHTNIPAVYVVPESLALDDASPISIYVDNCGHIAAKFVVDDLHLEPGTATLTLSGQLQVGTPFSASDAVQVK